MFFGFRRVIFDEIKGSFFTREIFKWSIKSLKYAFVSFTLRVFLRTRINKLCFSSYLAINGYKGAFFVACNSFFRLRNHNN